MLENYSKLLERISRHSGIDKEEIERRVEAKRAKLSGLISKEGAAQIVASELGISFDNELLKINELLPGMKKVNVIGKVIHLSPVRSFMRKGQEGKVVNLTLADETANIKVVLWDMNHIILVENNDLKLSDVIEISNGTMRDNELHLGSFSNLKRSSEEIKTVVTKKSVHEKKISESVASETVRLRAFIVSVLGPRFFETCPECRKKVQKEADGFICAEHGKVIADKRALVNLVLDDGTETIRAVVFSDNFSKLGLTDLEDIEKTSVQKEELLGKEMFFSGEIRVNKFFNNNELNIESMEFVDVDKLLSDLEKN